MDPDSGPDPERRQRIVDEEHLGLLAIGYYVSAGICAFFSLFGLLCAALSCFEIPYGALLGVFTFIVLDRASVKRLFAEPGAGPQG